MTQAAMSQSDFAKHIGVGRSYVTALKKQGRLIMEGDKVLVEPSMQSMSKTTGAPERAAVISQVYGDSREKKDHYAAELSRLDYEERCATLMLAADVKSVVADAMTTLRTRLESLPDQLSPQLAAISDEQQVRAMLADVVEISLQEVAERFMALAK